MRQVGEVAHADVFVEPSGRSKGCGIVVYYTAEDAERAVEELNDSELMGRKIFVRKDREANSNCCREFGDQSCRVYVGNLAWSVTWKDLKDHFRAAGEVVRADVMCDWNDGSRSKGYGIVEFQTPQEARAAINELGDTELFGRKIIVREDREPHRRVPPMPRIYPDIHLPIMSGFCGKGPPPAIHMYRGVGLGKGFPCQSSWEPSRKVFVGNLSWGVSWQDLKDQMRTVGDVVHVDIMMESSAPGARSRGCGVVEFSTCGAAQRAIQRLHNSTLAGRPILVREFHPCPPGCQQVGW